jgi:ABC-2 type transport system ATP-binding protein
MVDLAGEGKTILISSHQVAEVERIASHVAFLSEGKLVLTAAVEDLRQRIVRLRLRYETAPPDAESLGTVLQRNGSGKQWQAVLQDPDPRALERLRAAEGFFDIEETPLGLEEIYAALLSRKETVP